MRRVALAPNLQDRVEVKGIPWSSPPGLLKLLHNAICPCSVSDQYVNEESDGPGEFIVGARVEQTVLGNALTSAVRIISLEVFEPADE